LILLSLGSLLPLSSYFQLPPNCHLHIIDSHRPWNLQNLFGLDFVVNDYGEAIGEGRIWVWGDGEEGHLTGVKKSWEALEYEPSDSGSDSESGEDDEVEDEDTEGEDDEDEGEDEEGDENEDADDDGDGPANGARRKKRRRGSSEGTKKKRRKDVDPDKVGIVAACVDPIAHISPVGYLARSGKLITTEYRSTTSRERRPGWRLRKRSTY